MRTDALKGIAIFMIVLCHAFGNSTRYLTPFGGIGVAIFLICSGYGLAASYNKNALSNYWRKRIVSIWIPFLISALIYAVISGCYASVMQLSVDALRLVSPGFPIGWYLHFLLGWYVAFWIICLLVKKTDIRLLSIFICSLLLGGIYFVRGDGLRFEQTFSFFIGAMICWSGIQLCPNSKRILTYFGIGILVLAFKQTQFARNSIDVYNLSDLIMKTTIAISLVLMVCWLNEDQSELSKRILKFFSLLGEYSYSLYLCHGYFLCIFAKVELPNAYVLFFVVSLVTTFLFHSCVKIVQDRVLNLVGVK